MCACVLVCFCACVLVFVRRGGRAPRRPADTPPRPQLVARQHETYGGSVRWAEVSAAFPGKTDSAVRNAYISGPRARAVVRTRCSAHAM